MTRASLRSAGVLIVALSWSATTLQGQARGEWPTAEYVKEHYTKREVDIAMRDGITLHTSIY